MKRPRGTGCIFLRGHWWYIKYYLNGRPITEHTHTSNKSKALEMLKDRLLSIHSGGFTGIKAERTLIRELV